MKKKGFTLIELLVVIAIIGILSSVVVVSLNSARAKARDAKRIADIGEIKKAMELYYDSHNQYPENAAALLWDDELVAEGLLPSVPVPPNNGEAYIYIADDADGFLSYQLAATLEQVPAQTGVLASDRDCDSSLAGGCFTSAATGGFNADDLDATICPGSGLTAGACYDVTP